MNKNTDIIRKLIDGEFSQEEEKAALRLIESDPLQKEELDLLRKTIRIAGNCERKSAPHSFTSEVMRELTPHTKVKMERLQDFFFRQRMVRWNIAAAVAAVFFVAILGGGIFYIQKKDSRISSLSPETMITVRFEFYSPEAKSVSLAGDFNKWSTDEALMKKQGDGIWTIDIPLKPKMYSYMFVIDGKVWAEDPKSDSYHDDGFGNKNSVVRVSTS
ncbi:MAG: isoamylase early set domain-containing protein [Nitrospirae bacterium]|nr:isoamylase early set domain-containing protein [Nitrospirota bacterium]